MTKVKINPGVCGLITTVEAQSDDGQEVTVTVRSGCGAINKMFETLGNTFDSYEICLTKPGANAFYEYAQENLPPHAACPAISGIIKAVEAECRLALPRDASITFIND